MARLRRTYRCYVCAGPSPEGKLPCASGVRVYIKAGREHGREAGIVREALLRISTEAPGREAPGTYVSAWEERKRIYIYRLDANENERRKTHVNVE